MLPSHPVIRFVLAGQLRRDYLLLPDGKAHLDIPGGGLFYSAAGLRIWETNLGLLSRVSEDYPTAWLEKAAGYGMDTRGVAVTTDPLEQRSFCAYTDLNTPETDNPVVHFSRLEIPFPRGLLGYTPPPNQPDSRTRPSPHAVQLRDIPEDYRDATALHVGPLEFLNHALLTSHFRQGNTTTLTLDPSPGYMSPIFWDDIPLLVKGLTAFLPTQDQLASLFQGRSLDLWEMAAAICAYGCEFVLIRRRGNGYWLFDGSTQSRWIIPNYPAAPADPTGVGDAFCGGFLAGYCTAYDPLEAALYGAVSASMVIEGSGPFYPLDAMPGLAQARLDNLRTLARRA